MKSKKLLFLIISLLSAISIFGQIKVQFADSDEYYLLNTFKHEKINYFKLNDFNAIVSGADKRNSSR